MKPSRSPRRCAARHRAGRAAARSRARIAHRGLIAHVELLVLHLRALAPAARVTLRCRVLIERRAPRQDHPRILALLQRSPAAKIRPSPPAPPLIRYTPPSFHGIRASSCGSSLSSRQSAPRICRPPRSSPRCRAAAAPAAARPDSHCAVAFSSTSTTCARRFGFSMRALLKHPGQRDSIARRGNLRARAGLPPAPTPASRHGPADSCRIRSNSCLAWTLKRSLDAMPVPAPVLRIRMIRPARCAHSLSSATSAASASTMRCSKTHRLRGRCRHALLPLPPQQQVCSRSVCPALQRAAGESLHARPHPPALIHELDVHLAKMRRGIARRPAHVRECTDRTRACESPATPAQKARTCPPNHPRRASGLPQSDTRLECAIERCSDAARSRLLDPPRRGH